MSLAEELYGRNMDRRWNQPSFPGIVLAEVMDIKDPENLGRIKCKGLTEEDASQMNWCYVMSPFAGKEHGIQFLPDVGDIVVLGFIGADRYAPLVLGCLWNKNVPMPYPLSDGKNQNFSIKTPAGAEISFTGEEGKEKITVVTPAGTKLEMDDENQALNLQDKDGKNALKIDMKGGEIQLLADKKITLKTGSASLVLEGSGKATLKAQTSVGLEGASIEGKAQNALNLSGTQVEVKANAQLNLQSSGIANVKGSLLNLN